MFCTSFDLVWHLGYQRSSTYPRCVSKRMCLLDSVVTPSSCLTTLSIPGDSLSLTDPPCMNGAVATTRRAVFGECRVSSFGEINLPVSADLSEVLLLLGLLLSLPETFHPQSHVLVMLPLSQCGILVMFSWGRC